MSCCCFTSYNLKYLENIKKYINRATEYLTQEEQENKTQENQEEQENKTQENQEEQENKTQENKTQENQEEDEYDIVN
jgi:hypothetical protein